MSPNELFLIYQDGKNKTQTYRSNLYRTDAKNLIRFSNVTHKGFVYKHHWQCICVSRVPGEFVKHIPFSYNSATSTSLRGQNFLKYSALSGKN